MGSGLEFEGIGTCCGQPERAVPIAQICSSGRLYPSGVGDFYLFVGTIMPPLFPV
jgi:hypothetical protein